MTVDLSRIPFPLQRDFFRVFRHGVEDDPNISVYINETNDFVFLSPSPTVDYRNYNPRKSKLGLNAYSRNLDILARRLEKLFPHLNDVNSILEVGASDGAFLALVREQLPIQRLACVEPDQSTRSERNGLTWLEQFSSVKAAILKGISVDAVAMFHVFEHIKDPETFLATIRQIMVPGGKLIIEVPSLFDPLLKLYGSPAYQAFYFQRQHPFVYTGASLRRVLKHNGFEIDCEIAHQRYGLENHLHWLTSGKPGGNETFRTIFSDIEGDYRASLEREGITDTVIVVARSGRS